MLLPSLADPARFRRPAVMLLAGLAALASGPAAAQYDVPYVPTPQPVVDAMLEMGEVSGDDYLIDLGSGDGRIVVTAASRFGTPGMGVDMNPVRIQESNANAEAAGVTDKVEFKQQDLFKTDISKATVLTMYLLPQVNLRLRPVILDTLEPGTRVVSHAFDMGDWEPDETRTVDGKRIMRWIVPAKVNGAWRLEDGERTSIVTLNQRYQKVAGQARDEDASSVGVGDGRLDGRTINLTVTGRDGTVREYRGEVEGDRMSGKTADGTEWTAERIEGGGAVAEEEQDSSQTGAGSGN
ncbi:SAM-dependent methyltransferase [Indioceanicola profundi]|uniref:SAM-dependent methyltransferase n=1 Tax=Indioceanicola profundi TaxID=2220096 RepID=UPI000E6AB6CF|nr:methyltransferase domain-containing protein [Indioceanicola profundi]